MLSNEKLHFMERLYCTGTLLNYVNTYILAVCALEKTQRVRFRHPSENAVTSQLYRTVNILLISKNYLQCEISAYLLSRAKKTRHFLHYSLYMLQLVASGEKII